MSRTILDANRASRCVAHKKDGERCKKSAIKGGKVCRSHGGAAPQVQRSARERFNDLVDPMINIAHRLVEDAANGKLSASEQLQLAKFIADRTGFIPGKVVSVDGPASWELTLQQIITTVPEDLAEQIEAAKANGYPQPSLEDVMDAEVVDEEDDPRSSLPRIVPPKSSVDRASVVRVGSAEPPSRPGYRR